MAHAEPSRPGVDQVPERDRHECLALYRRHRFRAALDQEPRRPVTQTPTVVDVEAPRRGAPKLVADVLGHDAARDLALSQVSGNALLEQARELQLRQAYVPVRIALHVSQRVGVQSLDQPFGKKGHAVLLTPGAPLDDRALQDVGDPIEGNHALGELLTDDGQRRAGGAADAEGQMSGMTAHDRHEEPLVGRRRILHQIPHEVLANVDRGREAERRDPGRERQIVVDGLGNVGDGEFPPQYLRHGSGAGRGVVAADRQEV